LAKPSILVTGGAGFIGSNLVHSLIENGHDVSVVDDLSHGMLYNLEGTVRERKLRFHKGSFWDREFLRHELPGTDVVIHLAALTSVPYSVLHPDAVNRVNVTGTVGLLGACVKASVKRVIFASSAAVYGSHTPPLKEGLPPDPLSPYAASKASAEGYLRSFHSSYGLESVILRFMNVYGPRSLGSNEGVVPQFLRAITKKETLVIYGDGNQSRDLVHVSDVVDSIVSAIGTNASHADVFNIGTGRPTTINDLVGLLQDLMGPKRLKVRHEAGRKGDVRQSYASITKASRFLGFAPKVKLREGIANMLVQAGSNPV
jgi:UDP-glucose 4-epimerase